MDQGGLGVLGLGVRRNRERIPGIFKLGILIFIFLKIFISVFFTFRWINFGIIWDGKDPKAHPGSPPTIPGFPDIWDELGMAEPFQTPE